jgi:hypothetical protein
MVRKFFGIVAAVALASAAMFVLVGPASALAVNSLMVDKVVSGTAPTGTVFTVTVTCDHAESQTLYFNATGHPSAQDGDPITAPVITPAGTDSCTVNETVDGGASSVVYACAHTDSSLRATCSDDNKTVAYSDTNQGAATITITNTFEAPTTTTPPTTTTVAPTTAPAAVVAPANFTG